MVSITIAVVVCICVLIALARRRIPSSPPAWTTEIEQRRDALSGLVAASAIAASVDDAPWGFSRELAQSISVSASEVLSDNYLACGFTNPHQEFLKAVFAGNPNPAEVIQKAKDDQIRSGVRFSRSDWRIAFTSEVLKAISRADRKLQGRLLEAIAALASKPLQAMGDTVKPLSGDLKGLWRYRLGDYRLLYFPDSTRREVVLMSFDSRGEVYGAA